MSIISYVGTGEAEIIISIDKENLPVVDYGIMDGIHIGKQYNPVTVSHFSYKYFDEYIKNNNQTAKEIFLKHADWLVNNSLKKDNHTFFVYNFTFPPYSLEAPWYSAMAQVKPVLPLLNAYKITQDKVYLTTAKNLLNVLFIDINDPCKCGVTYKTLGNGWWFELYANGHANGPKVLNGMMFTLVDIYHYYNFTKDRDALYLFNQGILSLKNNLHNYDKNGTYSSYDKNKGNAPTFYHKVHLCLLDKLYNITKENLFKQYFVNWIKSYNEPPNTEKINEHCFATPVNKPLY
ncbi:D-glucuronyl C5-epimerase family protein [Candidatus Nitrosocosmicus sp. T]